MSLKNITNIFNCNKKNYQILIIFGRNIPETTGHQMTVQLTTSPNVCSCTTCGKKNKQNITTFYPMRYFHYLSKAQKHSAHIFDILTNISSNCFVF